MFFKRVILMHKRVHDSNHSRMVPSDFVWNHLIPSFIFSLCWKPTLLGRRLWCCTRSPGRDKCT